MPISFSPAFDVGEVTAHCGTEPTIDSYRALAASEYAPLMDWSTCEPTPAQVVANRWLDSRPLNGQTILHVGVGNSSLARLVAARARAVDAVTVAPQEVTHARRLTLPRYTAYLVNKYSAQFPISFGGRSYDYIVDTNLLSYVCCQRHAERYLETLAAALTPGGVVVTHRLGLRWTLDAAGVDRGWRLDDRKLKSLAAAYGWDVTRVAGLHFLGRPEAVAALGPSSAGMRSVERIRLAGTVFPAYYRMLDSFGSGIVDTTVRASRNRVAGKIATRRAHSARH